ncbi:MAG: cell division protein FtsX [Beijerinckiaceae bacterium]
MTETPRAPDRGPSETGWLALGRNTVLGRGAALVPARSIAGRALITVIAIMTFLAAIAAGGAQIVAAASSEWKSSIAREATIQVRPRAGRDLEADVQRAAVLARAAPGISEVQIVSRQDSERLLEPWLGKGLDFGELPVPRMMIVRLVSGATPAQLTALSQSLTATVPTATLDDHRQWVRRLATMANTVVGVGIAFVILVLIATGLAVVFATRGAVAANKDIVEVLHFIGADDQYIGREFGQHFLRLGLQGGLSGAAAAILGLWLSGFVSGQFQATPGGDQIDTLFGGFALGPMGFFVIIMIAALVAALTMLVSWLTVMRHLAKLG